jgi:two-component system NtrC family sensor kinase
LEQRGTITITTRFDSGSVSIAIRDTGQGIPAEEVDRIFEPAFTTSSGRVSARFGLAAAYDLVKRNGGELKVRSKLGEGTEFVVSMPARQPD